MHQNWKDEYLPLTWTDFASACFKLSKQLKQSKKTFDLIVAIARGGLAVSQLLSDSLTLPIASFTVQSYEDLKKQKSPRITYGLGCKLKHQRVLLVDDVSDSGKTFLRGIEHLLEMGTKRNHITTVSLHYKPHSVYRPDYFVNQTDKWIVYPYEVRETIENVGMIWQKQGITFKEMLTRFKALGFNEQQITYFLKQ